jgi:FkbM family methyltransferase
MSFLTRDGTDVDMDFEKEEQLLIRTYIPSDAVVLEMGARYGTASFAISEVLDDPSRHVAVEPDSTVIEALTGNRDRNGGKFHIFEGVVSKYGYKIDVNVVPDYKYYDYGTYTKPSDEPTVNNLAFNEIENKYNLKFDCIVADCEGFFYDFVKENEECLDRMRVIIYEQDGTPWSEMIIKYKELDTILESHGFKVTHAIPHPEYENNPRLHNVWVKELNK